MPITDPIESRLWGGIPFGGGERLRALVHALRFVHHTIKQGGKHTHRQPTTCYNPLASHPYGGNSKCTPAAQECPKRPSPAAGRVNVTPTLSRPITFRRGVQTVTSEIPTRRLVNIFTSSVLCVGCGMHEPKRTTREPTVDQDVTVSALGRRRRSR